VRAGLDWRRIESALADFFERQGFSIWKDGDWVAVAPNCPLVIGGACGQTKETEINLTSLAHELAESS
jgi:hypothetical protein